MSAAIDFDLIDFGRQKSPLKKLARQLTVRIREQRLTEQQDSTGPRKRNAQV